MPLRKEKSWPQQKIDRKHVNNSFKDDEGQSDEPDDDSRASTSTNSTDIEQNKQV